MADSKRKWVVAITGASGSIYAKVLLDKLRTNIEAFEHIALVMSANAETVWQHELGNTDYTHYPFTRYAKNDFMAPFASGSARFDTLIVIPCSMGTLGRIAGGVSDDLITRAADVMLKERRKLILVARDTPYNLIHLRNMTAITEAGGIICPATPSFYSRPQTLEQLAATVVDRVLDLAAMPINEAYRWNDI